MDRDRLSLTTPEGITLDLTLAGVGSRSVAAIIDTTIQIIALIAVSFISGRFAGALGWVSAIMFLLLSVVIVLGYPILFEVFNAGRTPGKSAARIRVVRSDGGPISTVASLLRNFLRIIDFLPMFYAVGIIAIFTTSRNQRIGDLAAGTVVVHEKKAVATLPTPPPQPPPVDRYLKPPDEPARRSAEQAELWETSRVTPDEMAVLERFLRRRADMPHEDRARMGHQLALRLNAKVTRPPTELEAEAFLERLQRARQSR